ncbi:Cytochrome P450 monooxygenase apf7 [Cladobotryum mycophilum]|uniref:Cytochrome P450 monooxygenase apf7 n=1 Tax=Cladobotryum mycophilum TaxID=491253 RepID=A0ABR0SNR4_9HYPO
MSVGDVSAVAVKYAILPLIAYHLVIWVYRFFLHPLRKYPGPRLSWFSDAYGGWFAYKKDLHLQTHRDHLKYGKLKTLSSSVIRQGPNKLIFNSTTAYQEIYLKESISKSQSYAAGNADPSTGNAFNTIDKRVHRVKRRLVGQLTTERSMRVFESQMIEQIDVFLGQILATSQTNPNAAIDMSQRCRWLGLDIVGHLGFGYDLKLQTDPLNRFLVHAMEIASWRLNIYMQYPFLRQLKFEALFWLLAVLQGKSFFQLLRKMIDARAAQDKHAKHDLYSVMVDAVDAPEGDRITMREIWIEAILFIPAGGDTSSTAMSSTFFYLARNPHCMKKLAEEIRSAFASGKDIRVGPELTGCRYLRACIDEALRMSPPVPGTLWRERSPGYENQPWIIDGHVIPRGTKVGVSAYCLHHNDKYFPDPFTYKPERFLEIEEGSAESKAAKAAFVPFSIGSRSCAGKAMAYQETTLTLAKTIWYFDFDMANEHALDEVEFRLQDVLTSHHNGPFLKFRPRGELWKELQD